MANYYTLFSGVLPGLTSEEETWLRQQLEYIYVLKDGQEHSQDTLPPGSPPGETIWEGYRLWRQGEDCETPGVLQFDYRFAGRDEGGRYLLFYADETGDPWDVALFVRRFLQRFRPRDSWWLCYAQTCSSPRPDAFGGGAIIVTAADIATWDSWNHVEKELRLRSEDQNPEGGASASASPPRP